MRASVAEISSLIGDLPLSAHSPTTFGSLSKTEIQLQTKVRSTVHMAIDHELQAVMLLPAAGTPERQTIMRPLCGIPVLVRVLAAANRAGVRQFILIDPAGTEANDEITHVVSHRVTRKLGLEIVVMQGVNADSPAVWRSITAHAAESFLWLPSNVIVDPRLIVDLSSTAKHTKKSVKFRPENACDEVAILRTVEYMSTGVGASLALADVLQESGLHQYGPITPSSFKSVRWQLVRDSGKETDGIYSRFNRRLVEPLLPFLCWSGVTPNVVTVIGLLLAVPSAWFFAKGTWIGCILGAIFYFLCVLFDELDGMLARLTFRSSPLGCWLETISDYASYLFLFGGLTAGMYKTGGAVWLSVGGALFAGTIATMSILAYQRKQYTNESKPNEFRKLIHRSLERDSTNLFSRLTRKLEFMVRKPAYCHYVLLFAVLNQPKALLLLTALGANIAWIMALSFDRLLRPGAAELLR
jgi:phosphatidylglycerophosphate synthase